jgi:thioredoxin
MNTSEIQLKISQSGKPVIVEFWAPWCGPCRMTKPILENLAQEYAGRVDLWEINVDENPGLLRQLKIYSVPTLVGYNDGREVMRYAGVKSRNELKVLFEALSTGNSPTPNRLSEWDRFIRLLVGTIVTGMGWMVHYDWFLLVLGSLVLFSAVYDRCPIWKAITTQFKKIVVK